MTKALLLSDLNNQHIECLRVLSFDPDIYLAEVVINGETHQVFLSDGERLQAFSQLTLKKHFKGFAIASAVLVHHSAYDEMVGNPPAAGSDLTVSIANPDQDIS